MLKHFTLVKCATTIYCYILNIAQFGTRLRLWAPGENQSHYPAVMINYVEVLYWTYVEKNGFTYWQNAFSQKCKQFKFTTNLEKLLNIQNKKLCQIIRHVWRNCSQPHQLRLRCRNSWKENVSLYSLTQIIQNAYVLLFQFFIWKYNSTRKYIFAENDEMPVLCCMLTFTIWSQKPLTKCTIHKIISFLRL